MTLIISTHFIQSFFSSICLSTGYFGVSLSSLTDREENISSEVQNEHVMPSTNLDDTNRIVTFQSHSSSSETPQPSISLNSKRKYSTSHIQRKVTPNAHEPSELETEAMTFETHSSTVAPHKSVFGSFTILDKLHFGDVFTAVTTPSANQEIRVTPTTVLARKKTSPVINKHSDLIETAHGGPELNETAIDEMLRHSPLESFAHNSLDETNMRTLEHQKEIMFDSKQRSPSKSETKTPKEEISGVGEAHVVVLPAASSNDELILSPHGTLHSKPTTYRPHTSKSRQTNQQNLPPEIVVTTEARKATPNYSHKTEPKQNRNNVQKQIIVLKEKPSALYKNEVLNRQKDIELTPNNRKGPFMQAPTVNIRENIDDYDSELKSITTFLKSEFPVLQKFGNLEEVLRAYKTNKTMNDNKRRYGIVSHEPATRGDLAVMESSHEFQYATTVRTPGYHHFPVVTLLPVRSNVGPGRPLRPRPYLGTRNNIGTTTITTSPVSTLADELDYPDEQANTKISPSALPKQELSHSNSNKEIHSIGPGGTNISPPKDIHIGFLEFADRFNRESTLKNSPVGDKGTQINLLKRHNFDNGSLNMKDFLLRSPSNISEHVINDFSESLLGKISLDDSSLGEEHYSTTEESRKVILNTEVVTSTSVKVSYGDGTASYTESPIDGSLLRRPKRKENFRKPKISNFWNSNEPQSNPREEILEINDTRKFIEKRERTPKMAQDFLLHSNIHKLKFNRSKKDQTGAGSSDRNNHARAPFVVYATSLENADNFFTHDSEQQKDLLKERDGQIFKTPTPKKSEESHVELDDTEKVVIEMSTRNNTSVRNENITLENTEAMNKAMNQNLLSQMVENYNRVISNESSASSLKYLIDQISQQHLKHSHHHVIETNISTKAIPSSFNFNQINGIPILTKVYTKVSKSNSTNKERNQTEFHLNVNHSGMKYLLISLNKFVMFKCTA